MATADAALVVDLARVDATMVDTVGGKAANLGEMAAAVTAAYGDRITLDGTAGTVLPAR